MTRNQRIALLALAAVVAVGAALLIGGGDEEDDDGTGAGATQSAAPADTQPGAPEATAPSAPAPPEETAERIRLEDHVPVDGVKEIRADKGDPVRLVVASDAPDEIHLHVYDITREAAPGRPARFRFSASIEGVFELESHEAEHAGEDPLIARLVVEPG
jgi:hypothetical protein